jgi:hypothetical protein
VSRAWSQPTEGLQRSNDALGGVSAVENRILLPGRSRNQAVESHRKFPLPDKTLAEFDIRSKSSKTVRDASL